MPSEFRPIALTTLLISDSQLERLRSRCEVRLAGWGQTGDRLTEEELLGLVEPVDILVVGYENITARVIEHARSLRLIACGRGNPVNIDVAAASARKIPVIHTPGRNATAAAEFTIGLMIDVARSITRSDRALRAGEFLGTARDDFTEADPSADVIWDLDGSSPYKIFRGFELHGKTLGLIGFGHVASEVARLAQAFGMRVIAYNFGHDLDPVHAKDVTLVDMDSLLGASDILSVHCKVTPESRGLLDRQAFEKMKPSAYLINTARAAVIDQPALLQALRSGRITGAALDVYWYEPLPANHPLLSFDNVILTPHLGGATVEVPERHSRMMVDDIYTWLDGGRPKYVFNPGVYK